MKRTPYNLIISIGSVCSLHWCKIKCNENFYYSLTFFNMNISRDTVVSFFVSSPIPLLALSFLPLSLSHSLMHACSHTHTHLRILSAVGKSYGESEVGREDPPENSGAHWVKGCGWWGDLDRLAVPLGCSRIAAKGVQVCVCVHACACVCVRGQSTSELWNVLNF